MDNDAEVSRRLSISDSKGGGAIQNTRGACAPQIERKPLLKFVAERDALRLNRRQLVTGVGASPTTVRMPGCALTQRLCANGLMKTPTTERP